MKTFVACIVYMLIVNVIFYLTGAFIAFDLNPFNWAIMSGWVGRLIILLVEIIILLTIDNDNPLYDLVEDFIDDNL